MRSFTALTAQQIPITTVIKFRRKRWQEYSKQGRHGSFLKISAGKPKGKGPLR
jgi:hypothetical protein